VIAVVLALGAALSYGLSDFIGGVCGRRASAWSVAALAGVGGGVFTTMAAVVDGTPPGSGPLLWGAAAGIGNGFGTAFLYRGLSSGRMGVVAPVSGVTAAVLPVAVGVLSGERPALLVWLGIAVALPAIWLVARTPVASPPAGSARSGLLDGILAGLGFGALFAALAQVPDAAGLWPLAVNQLVGVAVIVAVATVLGQDWVPRQRAAWGGLVAGSLGGLATLGFLLSTHHGLLTVTAVLTSLYPAATVVLAAVLLREHIHRAQLVGLLLCAVTVSCVAAG
jgi:drug/metabolite transporter (DMT)-like permease